MANNRNKIPILINLILGKDTKQVNNWISDNKRKIVSVVEKKTIFIMVVKEMSL